MTPVWSILSGTRSYVLYIAVGKALLNYLSLKNERFRPGFLSFRYVSYSIVAVVAKYCTVCTVLYIAGVVQYIQYVHM